MPNKRRLTPACAPVRYYRGADIPMSVIRRFARQVAERFQPEKIILFGSYAYGQPHADSDVDILVVMPARNQLDQAVRISLEIDPPLPPGHHCPNTKEHALAPGRRRLVSPGGRVQGEGPL